MLNSSHIRYKIEGGPKLQPLIHRTRKVNDDTISELYLTILSRQPTTTELQIVKTYGQTRSARGRALRDLAWALINSPEFSFRH